MVHTLKGEELVLHFSDMKIGDNAGKQLISLVDDEIVRIEVKDNA